ncbi:hypothetical protein G1C97_1803 [Bifidobacterium sp. DSM 109959]|uniref:Uncharacterized protein n=1 Tax=Bifidobacterium olomucense TaxID=2675324 RepID=A0A7Y0EYP8_9BIFI|nr:hypothetical protein [Bifidobacterium sp. DSM 109959]
MDRKLGRTALSVSSIASLGPTAVKLRYQLLYKKRITPR